MSWSVCLIPAGSPPLAEPAGCALRTASVLPVSRQERAHPRDLRASDADRAGVVEVLGAAYADGRITAQERDERMRTAYEARTFGELAVLVHDLPDGQRTAGLPDLDERSVGAVFGRRGRSGRWVVPDELTTSAVGATVTLDFTDAVFAASVTVVHTVCLGGTLRVLVPRTVRVNVHRGRLVGLRRVRARKTDKDAPFTVQVRVRGLGQVVVRTVT